MEKDKVLEILENMKKGYENNLYIDPYAYQENIDAINEAIDVVKHKGEGALEKFVSGFNDSIADFLKNLDEDNSKPVLDDVEKKYLGNIVRPFRKRVIGISKQNYTYNNTLVYILIRIKSTEGDNICLPVFRPKSGMYAGMKIDREYTLEELGL